MSEMTPLDELAAIRKQHGVSLNELSRATYSHLGMSGAGIQAMLRRGYATRPVEVALGVWLQEKGREMWPIT